MDYSRLTGKLPENEPMWNIPLEMIEYYIKYKVAESQKTIAELQKQYDQKCKDYLDVLKKNNDLHDAYADVVNENIRLKRQSHLTDEDAERLMSLIDKYAHYSYCEHNHTENYINMHDFIDSLKGE
jgi:hypothetical protein